jgi:translation initiation factor IF-1
MVSTSRNNTRSEQRMPLSLWVLLMSLLLVLIVPGSLAFQPLIDTTTRTTMSRHSGTGSSSSSYYDLSRRVGGSLMAPPMINSAHQQQQQRKHKSCLLAKKPQKRGGYSSNNSGSKSTPMRAERIRKPRDDVIEVEATVQESLPNAMFRCSINQKTINVDADANGAAASSSAEPNTTPPPPPPPPPSTSTSNQPLILATISGKIRQNMVKILVGDRVLIELSPYDLTRGRITFRYRS